MVFGWVLGDYVCVSVMYMVDGVDGVLILCVGVLSVGIVGIW